MGFTRILYPHPWFVVKFYGTINLGCLFHMDSNGSIDPNQKFLSRSTEITDPSVGSSHMSTCHVASNSRGSSVASCPRLFVCLQRENLAQARRTRRRQRREERLRKRIQAFLSAYNRCDQVRTFGVLMIFFFFVKKNLLNFY